MNPGAARVVDPDQGAAELRRQIHDLADFLRKDLAQRTAEDGEILGKDEDLATEDRAVAGDDRVAVGSPLEHAEARFAMPDVAVELEERAGIEQFFHSLAGEQLPLLALSRNRALAARMPRLLAQLGELAQLGAGGIGFGRHDASVSRPQRTCRASLVRVRKARFRVTLLGESGSWLAA